jgi:hypothetical protein
MLGYEEKPAMASRKKRTISSSKSRPSAEEKNMGVQNLLTRGEEVQTRSLSEETCCKHNYQQ